MYLYVNKKKMSYFFISMSKMLEKNVGKQSTVLACDRITARKNAEICLEMKGACYETCSAMSEVKFTMVFLTK